MNPFKARVFPLQLQLFVTTTAWLQLVFYMFDLHTDDKPKMTAAVDKELRLVKGRVRF